jgi:glucitol operon activator protein
MLASIMWVFQGILSYFQIKHYNIILKEMKQKGKILVGQHKAIFGVGSIIILVLDEKNKVIDAKKMQGITVFNRFKSINELENKTIEEIKKDIPNVRDKRIRLSLEEAIKNFY